MVARLTSCKQQPLNTKKALHSERLNFPCHPDHRAVLFASRRTYMEVCNPETSQVLAIFL